MRKAARAIIIEKDQMLVMHRNKHGSEYFTLVGGQVKDNETIEQALIREVKEETGLNIVNSRLVFIEDHPAPYNEQYIYLCEVGPHAEVAIDSASEEALMNRVNINTHQPLWVGTRAFSNLAFSTAQLQIAIASALKSGFPNETIKL